MKTADKQQYNPNDPPTPRHDRTQRALYRLFKSEPPDDYNEAAAAFLESVAADWPNPSDLHRAMFRHPLILGTSDASLMSLYDIIADYIIQGDAARPNVRERDAEYPAHTMRHLADKQAEAERRSVYMIDRDEDEDGDDKAAAPYGHIFADRAAMQTARQTPPDTLTAAELLDAIKHLQSAQTANARRLAPVYGVSVEVMRDRIRKLDPDNVKTCESCGSVFYARDERAKYCAGERYYVRGWERGAPVYERGKVSDCKAAANRKKTRRNRAR